MNEEVYHGLPCIRCYRTVMAPIFMIWAQLCGEKLRWEDGRSFRVKMDGP